MRIMPSIILYVTSTILPLISKVLMYTSGKVLYFSCVPNANTVEIIVLILSQLFGSLGLGTNLPQLCLALRIWSFLSLFRLFRSLFMLTVFSLFMHTGALGALLLTASTVTTTV